MKKVIETQTTGIDAIELLMDETLCEGRIVIPKMMVKQAGGVNQKLKAGKKYELMMRIAEMFPIELIETNENAVADNSIILEDDTPEKNRIMDGKQIVILHQNMLKNCKKEIYLM